MKNIELIIPAFTDAISGAFGGAVIGNLNGENAAIIGSILGALFKLFMGLNILQNESHQKSA